MAKKAKSKKSIISDIVFYTVLAVIFIFFIVFFISPRFMGNKKSYGKFENALPSSSWMENLEDSVKLSEINLPGTHDSATQFVQLAYFSKCQTKSIKKQLEMGYRYLDIRLAVDAKNLDEFGNSRLKFMHGFVNCKTGNRRTAPVLYLDSVIRDCYTFLEENPSETIVFVVKKDHGDDTIADFQNKLDSYIFVNNDKWFTENRIPTLGEVRGKLVLARRYEDEASLGARAGLNLVWAEQGNHDIAPVSFELNEQKNGLKVCVEDRYKYNTKDKWLAFGTALDNAMLNGSGIYNGTYDEIVSQNADAESRASIINKTPADIYITFLSTNGDTKFGHPIKYAIPLNKKLWAGTMNPGKNYGWVILDYATIELAQKIYMTNF